MFNGIHGALLLFLMAGFAALSDNAKPLSLREPNALFSIKGRVLMPVELFVAEMRSAK